MDSTKEKKQQQQKPPDVSRRKAVKTIAVGSAVVGAAAVIPLESLAKRFSSSKNDSKNTTKVLSPLGKNGINSDIDIASVSYVNLGQLGSGTISRDNSGAIASINYASSDGPPPSVTASVSVGSRNSDGSLKTVNATVNDTISGYNANSTATITRNPDGSISEVVWTGSSTGGV
jgi:hypothetical protein